MTEFLYNYFGWPTLILLLIPVAILVRIFVRTSRWSILKVVGITALGTLISSAWLFYASIIANSNLGGEWGKIALSLFRLVMIGAIIYGIYRLLKRGNVPAGIFVGAVRMLSALLMTVRYMVQST